MGDVATKVDIQEMKETPEKVEVVEKEGSRKRVCYFDKLSEVDQDLEKRMVNNIFYLARKSDYNISQVSNKLNVNLTKETQNGFKTGLAVTVVLNAAKLFGVNAQDIIYKDLEEENKDKDFIEKYKAEMGKTLEAQKKENTNYRKHIAVLEKESLTLE